MDFKQMVIKDRIRILTDSISRSVSEKKKYETSLSYANNLLTKLKKSDNYLMTANDNMKRFFTINNKTADGGKISNTRNDVAKVIKEIERTIIPSLKIKITEITNEINKTQRTINELKREYERVQI